MDFKVLKSNEGVSISFENKGEKNGVLFVDVNMAFDTEQIPAPVTVGFKMPVADMYSVWSPSHKQARHLGPNWSKRKTDARLASGMPLHGSRPWHCL